MLASNCNRPAHRREPKNARSLAALTAPRVQLEKCRYTLEECRCTNVEDEAERI